MQENRNCNRTIKPEFIASCNIAQYKHPYSDSESVKRNISEVVAVLTYIAVNDYEQVMKAVLEISNFIRKNAKTR